MVENPDMAFRFGFALFYNIYCNSTIVVFDYQHKALLTNLLNATEKLFQLAGISY